MKVHRPGPPEFRQEPHGLGIKGVASVEVPVVAEGALDAALIRDLAPVTDFFGIGEEIWRTDDPAAELKGLIAERNEDRRRRFRRYNTAYNTGYTL